MVGFHGYHDRHDYHLVLDFLDVAGVTLADFVVGMPQSGAYFHCSIVKKAVEPVGCSIFRQTPVAKRECLLESDRSCGTIVVVPHVDLQLEIRRISAIQSPRFVAYRDHLRSQILDVECAGDDQCAVVVGTGSWKSSSRSAGGEYRGDVVRVVVG